MPNETEPDRMLQENNVTWLQSVTGTPTQTFTYDATGSVTDDSQVQYAYDALGRLKQTTAGSQTTHYRVDALGERIKKDGTYYHYDKGGRLIAESDATGTIQREYVWLGTTPIAVID